MFFNQFCQKNHISAVGTGLISQLCTKIGTGMLKKMAADALVSKKSKDLAVAEGLKNDTYNDECLQAIVKDGGCSL